MPFGYTKNMSTCSTPSLSALLSSAILEHLRAPSNKTGFNLHKKVISSTEKALIRMVLNYHENNQTKAALMLGISRPTMRNKMNTLSDLPPSNITNIVEESLNQYWAKTKEHQLTGLYHTIRDTVETTLLLTVLSYTNGNQRRSADILNISRTTLRAKILCYGVDC